MDNVHAAHIGFVVRGLSDDQNIVQMYDSAACGWGERQPGQADVIDLNEVADRAEQNSYLHHAVYGVNRGGIDDVIIHFDSLNAWESEGAAKVV